MNSKQQPTHLELREQADKQFMEENKTEYCEECEEDQPVDTFKESNKWCSNVCESCWEKEQPTPQQSEFIKIVFNGEHYLTDKYGKIYDLQENLTTLKTPTPHKTKLEEFYIERKEYDEREKARKIEIIQERFNMRSNGATEKEIHKWGQKHRRNTNDRMNRFFEKWEDQIHEDIKLNGKKF
tara:strand:- start:2476 stop:3021 length:546 start_codon:yes stop_codon:yes gene_type:complete